jgi:predicted component of type VI protein secretion system
MALIDKIFGRKKTLSELDRQELRKEEILLTKQRDRLFKRIEQISVDKQKIFQQGATQKSPELRKALAQDFELKTQEQTLSARELNLRSKELLTVSRLRMIKENNQGGRALGRLNLTDKDVARISQWIEDDSVSQDMYQERLGSILELGSQSDKDALASAGLSGAGQEVMNIWNEMDRGSMKPEEAFEEADKAVRRRTNSMEKEL